MRVALSSLSLGKRADHEHTPTAAVQPEFRTPVRNAPDRIGKRGVKPPLYELQRVQFLSGAVDPD